MSMLSGRSAARLSSSALLSPLSGLRVRGAVRWSFLTWLVSGPVRNGMNRARTLSIGVVIASKTLPIPRAADGFTGCRSQRSPDDSVLEPFNLAIFSSNSTSRAAENPLKISRLTKSLLSVFSFAIRSVIVPDGWLSVPDHA